MVEFPYYSLPLTSAEVAKKLPRMHWLQLEDIKLAFPTFWLDFFRGQLSERYTSWKPTVSSCLRVATCCKPYEYGFKPIISHGFLRSKHLPITQFQFAKWLLFNFHFFCTKKKTSENSSLPSKRLFRSTPSASFKSFNST